jgi:glyoxylase I family protein
MVQISGFHHVSLHAIDLERCGDWYERVFGFECLLIEEDEDRVTMIMLKHPEGMLLCLRRLPGLSPTSLAPESATAMLSFRVASRADLVLWDERLAELGVAHSGPRQAHLGWALDVIDPSGLRIQLHTREAITVDDA